MQRGFRPVGFNTIPPVIKNLVIINFLVWIATDYVAPRFGIDLYRLFALHYPTSDLFRPHQLITHFFMHGGFAHILSNMFALWMFGSVLENYWGPKRFFIFYIVTALGAALIQLGFNFYEINEMNAAVSEYMTAPDVHSFTAFAEKFNGRLSSQSQMLLDDFIVNWSKDANDPMFIKQSQVYVNDLYKLKVDTQTVGASGAVFGVLLAFGMMFPNTEIMMLFLPVPIKAKYFVTLYGLWELYRGIQNSPTDNIAHFAHLGGMLFGYFLIRYWNKNQRDSFY